MEMTTAKQNQAFIDSITNSRMLEDAISWISKNMEPQDVFSITDLKAWAEDNGYIESENT